MYNDEKNESLNKFEAEGEEKDIRYISFLFIALFSFL